MKTVCKCSLLAMMWLISFCAFSTQGGNGILKDELYGFFLKGKKQKSTTIPFEFYANLIIVKIRIDNSDTLRFILDTGVSATIVTDPVAGSKLNQNFVRRVKLNGAGNGEALMASVSVGHTLQMGDIIGYHQNIVCLDEDIMKLSEYVGVPIHGIFGHDIFNNFVVTINFDERTITLTLPEKFTYKKRYGERYPIVVTNSKPYTDAIALVKNDKSIPIRLIIDTGASHALLLNLDYPDNIMLPDKVIHANLGRGLNGDIDGNIGRIGLIRMGSVEMKNIVASFPDSISFGSKFTDLDSNKRQGSIGCELLRRFITTINYREGYMALKPIRARMREKFEHDMSGMDIRVKGAKLETYYVAGVLKGSPAANAGLKTGDELVFFNEQNVQEMKITNIYSELSKKEGKEISLFVRRKGTLLYFSFRLKRLI